VGHACKTKEIRVGFKLENMEERDHMEDQGMDESIILK
jgi:hypothetical protein